MQAQKSGLVSFWKDSSGFFLKIMVTEMYLFDVVMCSPGANPILAKF